MTQENTELKEIELLKQRNSNLIKDIGDKQTESIERGRRILELQEKIKKQDAEILKLLGQVDVLTSKIPQ